MSTTTQTETIIDTRFSYYNDDCIHVMQWDTSDGPVYYAVDAKLTTVGAGHLNKVSALLDGKRFLGRFRPVHVGGCLSDDDCNCVAVQRWWNDRNA